MMTATHMVTGNAAVVAVVDGDGAQAAAAQDTGHGGVAQDGGDGDGGRR